ncbi:hypothetical protein PV735_46655 [Streptomyces turgidiscabies]|uniref:Uncharacterized protein n=1 Tax=Streptomyces turgidiscabies (strain Car8) TaxID=698760 RepID=L7FD91_STRT8|nr:hypothetical protein [Streptomyces turgidiscabies]ELP69508.1 hypothetical protein STRTUCAR8_00023 [Streptomyces turgidiscabies Car8]MDX3500102.1 hypothetical protein [Streptomyces turgidiscabies]GAQ77183.1 hypothetical protein T45_08999 [Streptomyces turgidiscabies]
MGTRHLARLQFEADGPAVEGEWIVPATAQDRYTEWVGLYGTGPTVVIQLIEETAGHEHVHKTWTAQGEVEAEGMRS